MSYILEDGLQGEIYIKNWGITLGIQEEDCW